MSEAEHIKETAIIFINAPVLDSPAPSRTGSAGSRGSHGAGGGIASSGIASGGIASGQAPIICSYCQGSGHQANHCNKKKADKVAAAVAAAGGGSGPAPAGFSAFFK